MKKILTFILFLPLFLFSFNYTTEWEKIELLDKQQLPKSALEQVNLIYKQAKKEENSVQFIRATIYKKNYATTLKENADSSAISIIDILQN